MKRLSTAAAMCTAAVLLAGCAGSDPENPSDPAPSETTAPTTSAPSTVTADDIEAWVQNTEWSYAPGGTEEPSAVAIEDGTATAGEFETYAVGEGVEGDANGDGIVDVAVPITKEEGNGIETLWYVWLGVDGAAEGEAPAEQMIYPIATSARCGHGVESVTAIDGGFSIDETRRLPSDDTDCATGGTGKQVRDVTVIDVDGEPYPMLVSPFEAWGGVCPFGERNALEGEPMIDFELRAAPPESAPVVMETSDEWAAFALEPAPLVESEGVQLIGVQPAEYFTQDQDEVEELPVRMQCAFGAAPAS